MTTDAPAALSALPFVNPHRSPHGLASSYDTVPAERPRPLPTAPRRLEVSFAGAGRMFDLAGWRDGTATTSLLVSDRGTLVHEWYAPGLGPGDLFLGASMTKSVLAHLVGIAVRAGRLTPDDAAVGHVPELAGGGYAGCRVRDLLTMTSGVDWVEDHRDPGGPAARLLGCFAAGAGASRDLLAGIGRRCPPGTRYEYCTADSQVLDWVRERATGTTFTEALGAMWAALGCEAEAVVATDAAGVALAGGGVAATARDWVRLALLQVDGSVGGTGDGARLLDDAWVRDSSRPALPFLRRGRLPSTITTHAGFGYHWWPLDDAGTVVTADGSRGQFGLVDRASGVVVVKTSQWSYADPTADRQCRDLCYLALPELARAATAATARAAGSTPPEEET